MNIDLLNITNLRYFLRNQLCFAIFKHNGKLKIRAGNYKPFKINNQFSCYNPPTKLIDISNQINTYKSAKLIIKDANNANLIDIETDNP